VLLDTMLRCPADARVFRSSLRPVIYCSEAAPERELDAVIVRVSRSEQGVDIDEVLADLVEHGVLSVLVEGGGQIHHSLVSRDLVDQIHLFIAPLVLAEGPGWVTGQAFSLGGAPRFRVQEVSPLGEDIHLILERLPRAQEKSV
jgi:riboflavin biosynthesis pyrimidine reductase